MNNVLSKDKIISKKVGEMVLKLFPIIGFVFVLVFFGIVSRGELYSAYNINVIGNQTFLYILGGLGVSFLFAQGAVDLSLGSTIALASILASFAASTSTATSFLVAVVTGLLIGVINGFIYSESGIPVFIQGLGMSFLIKGFLYTLTNNKAAISLPEAVRSSIDTDLNKILIVVLVTVVTIYLFNYTTLGKYSKAIGAGQVAAVQSGVDVKKVKRIAFIISGVIAGVVAFFSIGRTGAGGPTTGLMFEFNILIALVLGGMPMSGGAGTKLKSVFLGALMITIMSNGMVLWGVSSRVQEIAKGVIFIIVVVLTYKLQQKAKCS